MCAGGVPESACVMVFRKMQLKEESKMFKKSHFTRRTSRNPTNSEDGAICKNSLQLKAVHCSIVARSSILNVGSCPRPTLITIVFREILS